MPLPSQLPEDFIKKPSSTSVLVGNRYSIVKRIGSGNFGTAFLIEDTTAKNENDKNKVLKQICVGPLDPGETVDAMQEAKLLSQLKHKNIVQFHNSFLDGQFFCIVLEYCEGGDLECKIREYKNRSETVPEDQVQRWLKQLLRAIGYMHGRRILHRDLKSRNIFLKDNQVKIGDFGISRILIGTTDKASTFVGTPYYMSPEVLNHEQYDEKCDIWSLGCVLYEICCFEHAFNGTSLMDVMMKIVSDHTPQLPDKFSRALNNILQNMLSRDVTKRQTALQILLHPMFKKVETIPRNSQKFLTARERLRIKKQKEADMKMQRLKEMTRMKHVENERIRKESQERNFSRSSFDVNMEVHENAILKLPESPPLLLTVRENLFSEPLTEETIVNNKQENIATLTPLNMSSESAFGTLESTREDLPVEGDQLDLTDELLLSSYEEGFIPEDDDQANTYYSMQNDFESSSDDDDLPDDHVEMSDSEYRDMCDIMEDALHLDASILSKRSNNENSAAPPNDKNRLFAKKLGTVADPQNIKASNDLYRKNQTAYLPYHNRPSIEENRPMTSIPHSERPLSNFAENMVEQRINNMQQRCVEALGENLFKQAYVIAKQLRFDNFSENAVKRKELNSLVPDRSKCMDLEQLVYLENERKVT